MPTRFSHRLIAFLLAMFMPLCCCRLHIVAGHFEGASVAAAHAQPCCSKCETGAQNGEPSEENRSGGCTGCCTKFAGGSLDWSPPVDEIGRDLPAWSLEIETVEADSIGFAANTFARAGPLQPTRRVSSLVAMHCELLV